jgi:hypothetical protein
LAGTARIEVPDVIANVWQPRFPSPELVDAAAALLPAIRRIRGGIEEEGPVWRFSLGPGVVAVGTKDYTRRDRTHEREHERHVIDVDGAVAWFTDTGEEPPDPMPCRSVTEWSRKSRARMVRRLSELDYTPLFAGAREGRLPGMVTLTYPGEWLVVAPNGKAVKAHLRTFRERYRRAWGEDLACIWKLEFQRRGAPHVHMLAAPPHGVDRVLGLAFREWLSRTWAAVVKHPDPAERARHLLAGTGIDFAEGLKATDPRRVAVYFLKHNTAGADDKAYQHIVPEEWHEPGEGPGRFWGHWVLRPAVATVELRPDEAIAAARVMRRWSRAQGRTRTVTRPRMRGGRMVPVGVEVHGLAGAQALAAQAERPVKYRRTTTRVVLVPRSRGWISVSDGPAFAADIARFLEIRRGHEAPPVPPPRAPRRPADTPPRVALSGPLPEKTGAWRSAVSAEADEAQFWPDATPTDRERVRRLVAWQAAWARVSDVEGMHVPVP